MRNPGISFLVAISVLTAGCQSTSHDPGRNLGFSPVDRSSVFESSSA
ncbi:hypothetical protein [Neorhizobium petrolearium]